LQTRIYTTVVPAFVEKSARRHFPAQIVVIEAPKSLRLNMTSSTIIEVQPDVKIHVTSSVPSKSDHPTLVFLHFWGGSTASWSRLISALPSEYPTVAIDFRGWGASTGPAEAVYSVAHLADDVEAVLDRLSLRSQPIVLVGHSMGGKVAQAVAGRGRLSGLRALILVAPAPPTPLVLPADMAEQQSHAYDSADSATFVVRNVLFSPGSTLSDEVVKSIVQDMLKGNPAARVAWPAYGMGEDITDLAKRIRVPTLAIAASQDVVETVDRVKAEVCGNIEGSSIIVIEKSGHLIPVEAPKELSKEIVRFIQGL
jgi:pimeloyl-ACP methyl ester carboxylesterase